MPAILLTVLAMSLSSGELSGKTSQGIRVQRIGVSAIEAKTADVPLSFAGQQVTGQLKGTLTVTQSIDVDDGWFASVDDLRARLRQSWCPPRFTPRGEIIFNSGRNVSASLGIGSLSDQAVTQINLTYRLNNSGRSQPLTIHCRMKGITYPQKTRQ